MTGPSWSARSDPRAEPQKNGKTINWCSLDVRAANGTGERQWVVCGAHNFDVGDLVVVILPGGTLPTPQGPLTVSARKTYGHISAGMICSGGNSVSVTTTTDHRVDPPLRRGRGDARAPRAGADAIPFSGSTAARRSRSMSRRPGLLLRFAASPANTRTTGARFTDPVLPLAD